MRGGMDPKKKAPKGSEGRDQLTLELYASAEDGGTDSNEECRLEGEVENDLPWILERRDQDLRQACCRPTSTWRLTRDPLLRIIRARVGMFGEKGSGRWNLSRTVLINRQREAVIVVEQRIVVVDVVVLGF